MSDYRSWKKVYRSYAEDAIDLVRRCVSIRTGGVKTDTALRDLAGSLGTTHRRIRTLYHRDGLPVVLENEWMMLRFRVGLFLLNEAFRLRRLADAYEEEGNNLVSDQLEFSWQTDTDARRQCA